MEPKIQGTIHYMAWEIDKDCCQLTSDHYKVHHRGDFLQDPPADVAAAVDQIDPHHQMKIIICGGPPCPDYSRIVDGPGRAGAEGRKFDQFCQWCAEVIPLLGNRKIGRLIENVIPHRCADIHHFESQSGCNATIFDASNFRCVSRPGIWWSTIDWSDDDTIAKIMGNKIVWSKHFGTKKLNCLQPATDVRIPDNWKGPGCWRKGEVLHCLATPAPDEQGRAAPRSMRGRMTTATHSRWMSAARQYAPWHYEDDHVFTNPSGEYDTAPIETKESLHELPVGYTSNRPPRERHKMVANGWHI